MSVEVSSLPCLRWNCITRKQHLDTVGAEMCLHGVGNGRKNLRKLVGDILRTSLLLVNLCNVLFITKSFRSNINGNWYFPTTMILWWASSEEQKRMTMKYYLLLWESLICSSFQRFLYITQKDILVLENYKNLNVSKDIGKLFPRLNSFTVSKIESPLKFVARELDKKMFLNFCRSLQVNC